ncbi:hypothetical protein L596_017970 [Steinernema carpocapsae]|uniref:Uncharacterized protein n=1 Tax=Steinernema carpocapsae TaxID=34508 RepID=A0A4U5N3J2_STECR|nr:hypothetical protein L596_017970 [Steinernema carpocapsae]
MNYRDKKSTQTHSTRPANPRLHRTSKGLLRRPASFSPTDNVRNGPVAVLHACRPSHFTTRVIRGHLRRLYLLSSVPCLQRLSKLLQQPSTVAVPPKLRNRVEAEARQEALQLWQPQRQSSTKQRRDRRPGIREALALWSPRIHEVPAKQRFQGTHVGDHNVPKRFIVQPIQKLFQQPSIREVRPKLPRSEEDDAPGSEEDQKNSGEVQNFQNHEGRVVQELEFCEDRETSSCCIQEGRNHTEARPLDGPFYEGLMIRILLRVNK